MGPKLCLSKVQKVFHAHRSIRDATTISLENTTLVLGIQQKWRWEKAQRKLNLIPRKCRGSPKFRLLGSGWKFADQCRQNTRLIRWSEAQTVRNGHEFGPIILASPCHEISLAVNRSWQDMLSRWHANYPFQPKEFHELDTIGGLTSVATQLIDSLADWMVTNLCHQLPSWGS